MLSLISSLLDMLEFVLLVLANILCQCHHIYKVTN